MDQTYVRAKTILTWGGMCTPFFCGTRYYKHGGRMLTAPTLSRLQPGWNSQVSKCWELAQMMPNVRASLVAPCLVGCSNSVQLPSTTSKGKDLKIVAEFHPRFRHKCHLESQKQMPKVMSVVCDKTCTQGNAEERGQCSRLLL